MRMLYVAALALALAACGEPSSPSGEIASGKPPMRFRGDVTALVVFSSNIADDCREAGLKPVEGVKVEACSIIGGKQPVLILPNPCKQSGKVAVTGCHEIGHANGWPPTHGK